MRDRKNPEKAALNPRSCNHADDDAFILQYP